MTTYYNITATIGFDQIEAASPQEAAAKAYAMIAAQLAQPDRIMVWQDNGPDSGGYQYTSTSWTYDEKPQEIVYKRPEKPKPIGQIDQAVKVEVSVDTPLEAVEAPALSLG